MIKDDTRPRQNMFDQMSTHHNYMTDVLSTTGMDENLKSQVLQHISSHNAVIDQMRDSYPTDPAVQKQIHDHLLEHHELMQTLTG